jgi:hypothetical protein
LEPTTKSEFIDISVDFCRAMNEFTMEFCGEIANKALRMPFEIDDLPLCPNHLILFENWTDEDTIREIVDVMTDEDSIKSLKEDLDDGY